MIWQISLYNRMLGQLYHCLQTGQTYDPIKALRSAPDASDTSRRLTLNKIGGLWIGVFQATSVWVDFPVSVGVMSTGRSSSLPLWNTAPARTRATKCGALTARQRACAASISL